MPTYLFVTKAEYTPERVASGECERWSCSSTTRDNDRAFVYVNGVGIIYEWRVTSNASRDPEWTFMCDVEHARKFAPPITIQELREAVPRKVWAPFHRLGGYTSLLVPENVVARILALRSPNAGPSTAVSEAS